MKIGENTEFKLELKTIIGIVVLTSTLMGMYYTLEADIEEAKELPPSEIKRMEYDLKQKWQTEHIEDLEEKVDEILFWCRDIDKELHNKKNK
jgi:K+/H+ antiporter YhaU regulatory subunit KhtT